MEKRRKTSTQISVGDESAQTKTRTFDDIKTGEELPEYTKWITFKSSLRFASTIEDVFSGHINPDVAEGQFGIRTMPIQGAVIESGVTPLIVNWLRTAKPWLCGGRQETRFLQIVVPGDTVIYHGKVTDKIVEGDQRFVIVDVFAENQKGETVMVANAKVKF